MLCEHCGKEIPEGVGGCPSCAETSEQQGGSVAKSAVIIVAVTIGLVAMLVVGILAAIVVPNFIHSRDRAAFNSCLAALNSVKTGIQLHFSDNDNLDGIGNVADEVCNEIIPGHKTPDSCKGMVKKKIDAACAPDTFNIVFPGEFEYEVSAKVKDSRRCAICVSEIGPSPRESSLCSSAEPVCSH